VKIAVLTSSRADFGIYLPLLHALASDPFFEFSIIAFGSHLSPAFGMTIDRITAEGFEVAYRIPVIPDDDSPAAIATAMGKTMEAFAEVWIKETFDLVFALGDRFEMFAAVASGVPFNIRFAHIHGGETTKGAIDDAFRHSITHMSQLHFTCTEVYRQRVAELKGSDENVFNTGALSMDYLHSVKLLSKEAFRQQFGIDLNQPTILCTFHPETVSYENNLHSTDELITALGSLEDYQIVITMPNADTTGLMIRKKLNGFGTGKNRVHLVENFGSLAYLSCMKYCKMLVGNTSSGFLDASFFPKWVINLGNRQQGRIITPNIINCPWVAADITAAVNRVAASGEPSPITIYGDGNTASQIIKILKNECC
jgi:GDP/UDP-N,N'-diacetylbacillosamine 2-epimerase (hydrolysing)